MTLVNVNLDVSGYNKIIRLLLQECSYKVADIICLVNFKRQICNKVGNIGFLVLWQFYKKNY